MTPEENPPTPVRVKVRARVRGSSPQRQLSYNQRIMMINPLERPVKTGGDVFV